jgi:hypothetical protein
MVRAPKVKPPLHVGMVGNVEMRQSARRSGEQAKYTTCDVDGYGGVGNSMVVDA